MNILLTGGAGYVGSACLRWLMNHDHQPVAFDNLSTGNEWSVPKDRLIIGDIHDSDALCRAMRERQIEAVMHFAALAVVPESVADPEAYWRTNVVGTKNVLDAMRETDVAKIVFSGTCAVYGEMQTPPLVETMPYDPCTPYGTTKVAAERIIQDYSRAYGFGFSVLRYFNVSGADPDGEFGESRQHETHLIPLVLDAACGDRPDVKIFGDDWPTRDGTCVRDYIHTDDLALAHQLAIESIEPGTEATYNVGTANGVTVREVLTACEKVAGRPIPHEIVGRRSGDPAVLFANSDKIRQTLAWSPKYTDIEKIVETAWRWHQKRK